MKKNGFLLEMDIEWEARTWSNEEEDTKGQGLEWKKLMWGGQKWEKTGTIKGGIDFYWER